MKNKLNEKTIKIFFLIVRIIIVLVVIFLTLKMILSSKDHKKNQDLLKEKNNQESYIKKDNKNTDTDGDGLLDWEEFLHGTDTELADTDGDGVSDAQEVLESKDPLVFGDGTGDFIEVVKNKKEYFDEFIAAKEKEEERRKIYKKNIENYLNKLEKDIALSPEQKASREFLNSLGKIALRYSEDQEEYDQAFKAVVEKDFDNEDLKNLENQVALAQKAHTELSQITQYPDVLSKSFIFQKEKLQKSYLDRSVHLSKMINFEDKDIENKDFLKILEDYTESIELWRNSIVNFDRLIFAKDIPLLKGEDGYFFVISILN